MSDLKKIKEVVYTAIDSFNLSQEVENKLDKSEDEVLFSRAGYTKSGKLDSLTMVYFLVAIEEHLQQEFGSDFDLNTQDLIESKEDNLKNIATLISFIKTRI